MTMSSWLQEAREPHTAPSRLAELSAIQERAEEGEQAEAWNRQLQELRRRIAGNPNANRGTLLDLLTECPDEALSNPAFEMILLEYPTYLCELNEEQRIVVAECASSSEAAILSLLGDESEAVQEALAVHRHTPLDAVLAFTSSPVTEVRVAAAENPAVGAEWLELLVRAGSSPTLANWSEEPGEVTEEELVRLLAAGEWARSLVARHPQTPQAWFQRIEGQISAPFGESSELTEIVWCGLPGAVASGEPDQPPEPFLVRVRLASNPSLPVHYLEGLAADPEGAVRNEVAANPSIPESLQQAIVKDWLGYREESFACLARNPSVTPALLRQLSTCGLETAAQAALENPKLEPSWRDLLRRSGLDQEPGLRGIVDLTGENSSGPASSEGPGEQAAGKVRHLSGEELLALLEGGPGARRFVAAHPATPIELLRSFARAGGEEQRRALASNPSLDDELKRELSMDSDSVTLRALAAHSLPPEVLDRLVEAAISRKLPPLALRLCERPDLTLAQYLQLSRTPGAAAYLLEVHPTLPGLVEAFVEEGDRLLGILLESPVAPPSLLAAHARSGNWVYRQSIGLNSSTPTEALALLAADEDFRVRAAVAANLSSPNELLARLTEDSTPRVQQLAQARLAGS